MLFNSYVFCLAFFPIVWIGYYILNVLKQRTLSKVFLFFASLYFYTYFKITYLPLILGSILLNYLFSMFFERENLVGVQRKMLLRGGVAFNLGVIGYYKYYDFFVGNLNTAFGTDIKLLKVMLPLGISFFTFQQLSFVIDCYKRETPHYKLLDYALFVSYFPQLIAGPIVSHDELIPQFEAVNTPHAKMIAKGITAFALGLAKKVLIADTLGNAVNWGYSNLASLTSGDAILVMLAYTFQIYFDFSGYCDMAIGIGYMMNIQLPQNFNSPYRALTITEFWERWHMTLTRFFTRYIYIPLGGNRKGVVRTYINVMIVYLCSGIWHGANWTFILWGVIHGIACIADRLTQKYTDRWHPVFKWMITFAYINVTWIYFRADSIQQANQLLGIIGSLKFAPLNSNLLSHFYTKPIRFVLSQFLTYAQVQSDEMALKVMLAFMVFVLFASINMKNTNERIENFRPKLITGVVTAVLLTYSIISFAGVSTFLYFNF